MKKKIFLDPKLGPGGVAEEITKQLLVKELYLVASSVFKNEEHVSPASLQRKLQIPYYLARNILDKMITEGFCEAQNGAAPCRVLNNIRKN